MTRTIYTAMTFVGGALWVLFVIGLLLTFSAIAGDEPVMKVWAAVTATIGCMFGAILMQAIAAIGNDLYVIRIVLAGDELGEEETDPHNQEAGEA